MLEIRDLSVSIGGRRLLRDICLTARPGRVTAIIGPNGSGKSTLLKAVTGEYRHEGHALLNGHDIARTKPALMARMRAVLAQETRVAFPFTVAEIVGLGLEAGGSDLPDAIPRLLAEVDLAGKADRPLHELSGGEQQRVHLARAMAQVPVPATPLGPGWLFLDEPVSSLDIAHQLMVMTILRRFADAGGGVVMVMHDLNLTAMTADQVLLLRDGAALALGTTEVVLTDENLGRAYGCALRMNRAPPGGQWVLPQSAA